MNLNIRTNSYVTFPPDYESYLIENELNKLPSDFWLFIGNEVYNAFRHESFPDCLFFLSKAVEDESAPTAFPINPISSVCGQCDDSEANNCIHLTTLKNYILTQSFARN